MRRGHVALALLIAHAAACKKEDAAPKTPPAQPAKATPPKPAGEPAPVVPSSGELLILATGDIGGDTEPCGCKARPMGGVSRRAKVVKDAKAAAGDRWLVVDAGDQFFRAFSFSPRDVPQAGETARFLADSMKRMGASALAVGERDLAMGLPMLRELGERSGAALLAANLVHAKTGTAAFPTHVIVERGGIKVGIVGVGLEMPEGAPALEVYARAGLRADPAGPALAKAAKAARDAGADVVLALMHLEQTRAREILSGLPEPLIDVAIAAHDRDSREGADMTPPGPAALIPAGERGKWVREARLIVRKGTRGIEDSGALQENQRFLEELGARIAEFEKPVDAGTPDLSERLNADRRATVERLTRQRAQLQQELAQVKTGQKHALHTRMIALDTSLAEDPEMKAAEDAYKDRLKVVNAAASGEVLPQGALHFVGNEGCVSCHPQVMKQWRTTGHARAWATMERTKQTANLDCVPCHVTGFDRPGGPTTISALKPFVNVGCESCHGAGSAHAADPRVKTARGGKVPEEVCAECHRQQADQKPFHFEERLPKILGLGHGR